MNTFQALEKLSDELALGLDIATYEALSLRSSGSCRIAVMGLVSRGKSTLVNQLIGRDLLPVSHRGETASDVHIESGPEATRLRFEDGSIDERLLSPEKFSRAILRSSVTKVLEARISIPCRLPTGVVLVDTPGIDDAVSQTDRFDYLNSHWKRSGAAGAIVVVSVPPGLGRSDRQLVATAHELFGSALAVIVKPTDSTVTDSDLREVATQVHLHIGVAPVVLSDIRNPGKWGEGSLAPVEMAIMQLVSRSEQSRADASMRLADIHATITTAIRSTSIVQLERLRGISQLTKLLPTDISAVVNEQIALLETEFERQQKLRQESERSAHLALLDAQAAEFIKVLKGVRPQLQPNRVFSDALLELIPIAKAGSKSARDVVRSWSGALAASERKRLGIQLLANRRRDDLEFLVDILEHATLEFGEVESLLKRGSQALLGVTKTKNLISRSMLKLNVDQLTTLVTLTQRPGGEIEQDCRKHFVSKLEREVSETLGQIRGGSGIGGLQKLRQIHSSYVMRLESLQSQIKIDQLVEVAKGLHENFERDTFYTAEAMATATVDSMFVRRHNQADPSIAHEAKQLRDHVQWLNSVRPSKITEDLVRMCGEDGALMRMDRAVEGAILASAKHAESVEQAVQIAYFLSFCGWALSIFLLGESPGAAFFLWLVSFVTWLLTRNRRDQPKTWKEFYRPPSPDQKSVSVGSLEDGPGKPSNSGNSPDMTIVEIPPLTVENPNPPIRSNSNGQIGVSGSPESAVSNPQEIESEDLRNADFFGCDLSGWSFHRCDLRGVRFDGATLTSGRITQCNVEGASFRGAKLQGVRFHGQWFQSEVGPTIAGSEMVDCDFEDADLTGAFMAGVNLRGANFRNAILNGVDFRGINSAVPHGFEPKDANLSGAVLDCVMSDSATIWPTGFSLGGTSVGDVPSNSQSVVRSNVPSKADEPFSDVTRSYLQGQLNVSLECLVEGTCRFIDVGREATLVFRVSDSFDKAFLSAIEVLAPKLSTSAVRLTWASRKGNDGLWEPIVVVAFGDPTHDKPPAILGVIEISDYRTSDRTRWIIGQRLSVLPIENSNFYVLPPVLLWDGTFSADGAHIGMRFSGTVVTSKALRPIHLDFEGMRTGNVGAQTKSMSQELPGTIRLSKFLPSFFLQESVGGDIQGT